MEKYNYKKAMFLFEEEVILAGENEPKYVIACVFEGGEAVDYDGSPISWLDVDWTKTNELWESQGKCSLRDCDFPEDVRVDFINGSWRLITKKEDDDFDEDEGDDHDYEDDFLRENCRYFDNDDYDDDDEDYDEDNEGEKNDLE